MGGAWGRDDLSSDRHLIRLMSREGGRELPGRRALVALVALQKKENERRSSPVLSTFLGWSHTRCLKD